MLNKITKMSQKQIVVVLGMHRGGTSCITRGLQALGVDLGGDLYPARAGDNDKGFWEDRDINALNVELLKALGYDWHSLTPLLSEEISGPDFDDFKLRAVQLLRHKTFGVDCFGLKDPRMSRLLPFWENVFAHLNVQVSYVIACRHPMSVVRSLAKRDGFAPEKSYHLWLEHMLASLLGTKDKRRIFIDYDLMMADPGKELRRIAQQLNFPFDESSQNFIEYRDEFLAADLQHTIFTPTDFDFDSVAPPQIKIIYQLLLDMATDRMAPDAPDAVEALLEVSDWLKQSRSILHYINQCEQHCSALAVQLSDQWQHTEELSIRLSDRGQGIEQLNAQIFDLHQQLKEMDAQTSERDQHMQRKNIQISNLRQEISLLGEQFEDCKQKLESQNALLASKLHELDLNWHEVERLKYINAQLRSEVESIVNSCSWRMTSFVRVIHRHFNSELAPFLEENMARAMRYIWHRLPISASVRNSIRERLIIPVRRMYQKTAPIHQEGGRAKNITDIPTIQFDSIKEEFIAYKANPDINSLVKVIAFYLPQFHPFPENDEWWGKGFTEWSNVGKAKPNYAGHYQPHCPIHLGYYDLRVPDVMEEQARLAKQYGIYGFNYYFYWFAGKILMDTPLEMMLSNPKVDIPFCLTWANENWTRRWDGQESDVLIAQDHNSADSLAFICHLVKYFKDERYIKIDGKPVLIVYRANIIPDMAATACLWREEVRKHGIPDLYLICAQTFGIRAPHDFGFDASVEFPPHTVMSHEISGKVNIDNQDFSGCIFSYDEVVEHAVREKEPEYKLFRAAMLSWDNTARKQNHSHIFHGFSLLRYKQWLSALCDNVYSNSKYNSDEKIVFVNAWNEWAEGTHLEPDRKYGYGYLQATYDVLSNYDAKKVSLLKGRIIRKKNYAVMVHVHYVELWPEIRRWFSSLDELGFDLYVTTTTAEVVPLILSDYPDAYVQLVENRGRDILPFIKILNHISQLGYVAVCKLHTKRSAYREDGDEIRSELYNALVGSELVVKNILERFKLNSSLGMIVPGKYLIAHTEHNMTYNHYAIEKVCKKIGVPFVYDMFPAGSMFWFRVEALSELKKLESIDFDIEYGLADGTLPHAVERIFCLVAKHSGYSIEQC